jgi:non-specific serine/threonine protein kinase
VAGAVVADRIGVVGGITDDGGASNIVESYDPATDRWQSGPDLPEPLHHVAAATFRGELVVVGGFTGGGADLYDRPTDRVLALRGDAWVDLPRLRRPRGAAAVAVVGDTLYVVGGRDRGLLVRPTEAFDGTAWSDRAPIPVPRDHLGAAADGRYVYAVGGRYLAAGETTDSVERYEPAADAWQTLPPLPTARGGLGLTVAGGHVIAAGGEDASRVFPEVEALDPVAGKWTSLPPMPAGRHGLGLVTRAGTVYALVGGTAAGVAPSAATDSLAVG